MPKNEKNTCTARSRAVHHSAAQKTGENAGGAAPITFHAQKTTFRAVLRTKRREGAIVGTERKNPPGGRPPGPVGGDPYGKPLCPRENDSGGA